MGVPCIRLVAGLMVICYRLLARLARMLVQGTSLQVRTCIGHCCWCGGRLVSGCCTGGLQGRALLQPSTTICLQGWAECPPGRLECLVEPSSRPRAVSRSVPGNTFGLHLHQNNLKIKWCPLSDRTQEWLVGLLTVRQVCFSLSAASRTCL